MQTRLRDNLEEQHYGHGTEVPQGSMELLYIWINEDETGFIQQQGFNFSPNYHFEMKVIETNDDGKPTYELTCTENPNYPNVWKTGNIVNLTAVVGENGSGKSALLRYISNTGRIPWLTKKNAHDSYSLMVQVYRINDYIQVFHNCYDRLINRTKYRAAYAYRSTTNQVMERIARIYMTNAFFTCDQYRWKHSLVFSPEKNSIRAESFFHKVAGLEIADSLPSRFRILQEKIIAQKKFEHFEHIIAVSYYCHLHSAKLQSTLLAVMNKPLVIGVHDFVSWFPLEDFDKLYPLAMSYEEVLAALLDRYIPLMNESDITYKRVIDALYAALDLELLFLMKYSQRDYSINVNDLPDYLSRCLSAYKNMPDRHDGVLSYYESALMELAELESILAGCKHVKTDGNTRKRYASSCAIIDYNSEEYPRFCSFLDKLMRKEHSFVLKHLIISLPQLSSGEQALQNIFSWLRLPPSFKEILGEDSVPIQDNILLLLDEVDLYMHPEWQRNFLHYLSKQLEDEYKGKHIQIIFSTHSPLVLSDIPSSNIIYLEKNDEKCTIAQRSEQNESFGANIYSLLKDSFFLKRSIGEFAYSRISEMIKELEKMKECSDDQDQRAKCVEYRRLINIIGEPVLRKKLLMMCDDILGKKEPNPDELALERIEQLLKRDAVKYRERLMKMLSDVKPD